MMRRTSGAFILWIACPVFVSVLSGCAAQSTTTVTEQSQIEEVDLPNLVVEERVAEEPVVSSSEPPFSPEEGSTQMTASEEPSPLEDTSAVSVFLLDVPFNFDQAQLRDDAVAFLEVNAIRLKEESIGQVLLEGRGDEVGTSEYNLVLGDRRAQAVKRYLQNLGLNPSNLLTTSYGKERPLCREHNVDCWQMNRSVHLVPQSKQNGSKP